MRPVWAQNGAMGKLGRPSMSLLSVYRDSIIKLHAKGVGIALLTLATAYSNTPEVQPLMAYVTPCNL